MKYEYAHIFRDDLKLFWQDQQKCALNHSNHRLKECIAHFYSIMNSLQTYFETRCWKPCLYSCSYAGTTTCFLLKWLVSSLSRAFGAGSRHSGINTMNESGSGESARSRSKWFTIASINSSQKGGFASNEPLTALKSKIGLKNNKNLSAILLIQLTNFPNCALPSLHALWIVFRESANICFKANFNITEFMNKQYYVLK